MWSKFAKIGTGLCAALGIAIYYQDDIRLRASTLSDYPPSYRGQSQYFGGHAEMFPRSKWDKNWDFREPMSLVDQELYEKADEKTRKEMLEKVKPTATRHILLIRHGQYHIDSEKQNLTVLGKEQAILVGQRLKSFDHTFDSVIMSTMCRATETANLIIEQLNPIPYISDSILEEGLPFPPEPPIESWTPTNKQFSRDGSRIEAAFRKYIHRASVMQQKDSWEVIVCHANVIRYFICRALQQPPESWLRLSIGNCSITWIIVEPNGRVLVRSFGDTGHLPAEKATFTSNRLV